MSFASLRPTLALVAVTAFAVVVPSAHAELIYGVTDTAVTGTTNPFLVSFDSATPNVLNTIGAITGLVGGQTLRGIDFRPSNGLLYALSNSGTGTAAQLYTINLSTGVLTTVGSGLTLTGNASSRISLDFNPVADALRVVTGNAQSYRVNASTGALIAQDTSITPGDVYADIAYSNNVAGATSTTLYAYDYTADTIGRIGGVGGSPSPNGGQYTSIGATGIVSEIAAIGFDISGATSIGFVSLDDDATPDANTEFYTVNLGTGALTFVGNSPTALLDISVRPNAAPSAVAPEPGPLALLLTAGVPAVGLVRRRRKAAVSA